MLGQVEKDIAAKKAGVANPHWHFEHSPLGAPEMADVLKRLKQGKIPWTSGSTTPSL